MILSSEKLTKKPFEDTFEPSHVTKKQEEVYDKKNISSFHWDTPKPRCLDKYSNDCNQY